MLGATLLGDIAHETDNPAIGGLALLDDEGCLQAPDGAVGSNHPILERRKGVTILDRAVLVPDALEVGRVDALEGPLWGGLDLPRLVPEQPERIVRPDQLL